LISPLRGSTGDSPVLLGDPPSGIAAAPALRCLRRTLAAGESARGLAHSKTLREHLRTRTSDRFWSAAVLCRFRITVCFRTQLNQIYFSRRLAPTAD